MLTFTLNISVNNWEHGFFQMHFSSCSFYRWQIILKSRNINFLHFLWTSKLLLRAVGRENAFRPYKNISRLHLHLQKKLLQLCPIKTMSNCTRVAPIEGIQMLPLIHLLTIKYITTLHHAHRSYTSILVYFWNDSPSHWCLCTYNQFGFKGTAYCIYSCINISNKDLLQHLLSWFWRNKVWG